MEDTTQLLAKGTYSYSYSYSYYVPYNILSILHDDHSLCLSQQQSPFYAFTLTPTPLGIGIGNRNWEGLGLGLGGTCNRSTSPEFLKYEARRETYLREKYF